MAHRSSRSRKAVSAAPIGTGNRLWHAKRQHDGPAVRQMEHSSRRNSPDPPWRSEGPPPLESTLETLGPADALARAYSVELMLNPRRPMSSRAAYRLKVAGLIAAGSLPTLLVVILLGGVGGTLVLAGLVAAVAGVADAFGELPPWIQTSGMAPVIVLSMGGAMMLVGLMGILALRRFMRFLAATWRMTLPKLVA